MDFQLRPDRDLTILIPARAGSKRIHGKNTKLLGGKPLIQWTIEAAQGANVREIIVSSDDDDARRIALGLDCATCHRKPEHATDDAPDISWVLDALPHVETPYVAICRPTSPFRTASTIRRGYALFRHCGADSIRAVERVTSPHPAKMWIVEGGRMRPVMTEDASPVPLHSMPTQLLPVVYKQNASLEITSVESIQRTQTISGFSIAPFFTDPVEGVDINTPEDWARAEAIASTWR